MTCYHCKQPITKRNRSGSAYVPYRIREDGPLHKRYWCNKCNTDANVDAEYPKDWRVL